ncbi:MAG: EamA family transporter [Candidatus Aminicenantes bacterium]|nr:EamA family transporter [Candidatus Aminicenantes bacterium]
MMKKAAGYVSLCLIWGTTWMAIKIGLQDLTPFFSLGIRYLLASVFLAGYLYLKEGKLSFRIKHWKLTIAITLFNYILPYCLVYWGEQYIYSDLTSVIFSSLPLNISLLTLFIFREERFSAKDAVGIFIGFAGIFTIFSEPLIKNSGFNLPGMISVYLASVSAALVTLIIRKSKEKFHPIKVNLVPVITTGILITGISLLLEDVGRSRLTVSAFFAVSYLAMFGTVFAFAVYFWLIRRIKLSLVASISYITPLVAIFAGWVFLKENLSLFQIIGASLVLSGVFLTLRKGKKPPPTPVPE